MCPPGFISASRLAPCTPCDVDAYWVDSNSYSLCGMGSTVHINAVTSIDGCKGN